MKFASSASRSLIAAGALLALTGLRAAADAYPRQPLDVEHYDVAITFGTDFTYEATVRVDVRLLDVVDEVHLDLQGPTVVAVTPSRETLERVFGGTYEAFIRLTPVVLGLDEDALLGVDSPRAQGDQWPMSEAHLRRLFAADLHMDEATIDAAIARTEAFFQSVGVGTRLSDYGLTPAGCQVVVERFRQRGTRLGERQAIGADEIAEILDLCA